MKGYVATIGMFDGVHRGHQFVLHEATVFTAVTSLYCTKW